MKARTPAKGYTPGTLADPAFKYRHRPSFDTDIRRTIARAQREQARATAPAQGDMFKQRAGVAA